MLASMKSDEPIQKIVVGENIQPQLYYEWNCNVYFTVEEKRRGHLLSLLKIHGVIMPEQIVDYLVHDLDKITSVGSPLPGFRCSDGRFFRNNEEATVHQAHINRENNAIQVVRKGLGQ